MAIKYIKTLEPHKFEAFINDDIETLTPKDDKFMYLSLYPEGYGPKPEFHVSDFHFKGINAYQGIDMSQKWRYFVLTQLSPELREQYANEFNALIEEQKLTIKLEKK